ncbi:MAG: zinc-ribbon domain-containing protein [Bacteroidetes bacterium]|nr:zinc-ribbon domain-containing protein [Bacteroidota bacterium]
MFIVFGWNHTKVTEYGAVQEEECTHCHNKDIWQLKKIARYFTLFFIPVFPHDSEKIYHCPICNNGLKLETEDFENYKAIAQVNTDCLEKKISEDERLIRLKAIHNNKQERKASEKMKHSEESNNWTDIAAQQSTHELQLIVDQKQADYNPAFIIAAKKELEKRKTNI